MDNELHFTLVVLFLALQVVSGCSFGCECWSSSGRYHGYCDGPWDIHHSVLCGSSPSGHQSWSPPGDQQGVPSTAGNRDVSSIVGHPGVSPSCFRQGKSSSGGHQEGSASGGPQCFLSSCGHQGGSLSCVHHAGSSSDGHQGISSCTVQQGWPSFIGQKKVLSPCVRLAGDHQEGLASGGQQRILTSCGHRDHSSSYAHQDGPLTNFHHEGFKELLSSGHHRGFGRPSSRGHHGGPSPRVQQGQLSYKPSEELITEPFVKITTIYLRQPVVHEIRRTTLLAKQPATKRTFVHVPLGSSTRVFQKTAETGGGHDSVPFTPNSAPSPSHSAPSASYSSPSTHNSPPSANCFAPSKFHSAPSASYPFLPASNSSLFASNSAPSHSYSALSTSNSDPSANNLAPSVSYSVQSHPFSAPQVSYSGHTSSPYFSLDQYGAPTHIWRHWLLPWSWLSLCSWLSPWSWELN